MKLVKASCGLLGALALTALLAPTALADSPGLILVLSGEKVSELTFEGKAGTVLLETAKGLSITCSKASAKVTFSALSGKEADAEQGAITTLFEGCKKESVNCRSETSGGEKDPIETILVSTTASGAAEETTEKELQFVLAVAVNGTLLVECGVIKQEVRGALPCLVAPALTEIAAGETVKVLCALEKPGKQKTGKCVGPTATCEKLAKEPLEGNLGNGFEACAEEAIVEGTFNKMAFLDD